MAPSPTSSTAAWTASTTCPVTSETAHCPSGRPTSRRGRSSITATRSKPARTPSRPRAAACARSAPRASATRPWRVRSPRAARARAGVECAGPRYCAFTGGVCPGVCTDLEASGAACQSDEACQDGLVCLVDAASGDGVCGALGGEGDTCSGDDRCAAGASCVGADPATDTLGSCTSWSNRFTEAEGAACDPAGGQLCSEGLSCVVDGFVPGSGVTFSCSQPFASGAACQVGFPNACPVGEYCDADLATGTVDGMCMKSPTAGGALLRQPRGRRGARLCSRPGLQPERPVRRHLGPRGRLLHGGLLPQRSVHQRRLRSPRSVPGRALSSARLSPSTR
jgi:hypothetical protein